MDKEFIILWVGIVILFILRIIIWFIIKKSLIKKGNAYEYFSDFNANSIVRWIPKNLNLVGKSKMWARFYNQLTHIIYVFLVINLILLVIENLNNSIK